MSLPVIVDPEATAEFNSAYDLFEERRSGYGDIFAMRIQDVFDRISKQPRVHAVVLNGVRKAVVKQFTFCIYYREEAECVRVLSIFHTSRDPEEWMRRT